MSGPDRAGSLKTYIRPVGTTRPAPSRPSYQMQRMTGPSPFKTFMEGAAKALLRGQALSRKPPFSRRCRPWLMPHSAQMSAKRR